MNFKKGLSWVAVVTFALGIVPSLAFAQPGSFGGGYGPALKVVSPPKVFTTADEHYAYLFAQAKGGTKQILGPCRAGTDSGSPPVTSHRDVHHPPDPGSRARSARAC